MKRFPFLDTRKWIPIALALLVSTAFATTLKHRYEFEIDGRDSLGGPGGTLVDGAEIFEGALYTPAVYSQRSAFLLPAPSLVDLGSSFSVESWYTPTHPGEESYFTIFGLGTDSRNSFVAVRDRGRFPTALPNYAGRSSLSVINGNELTRQTLIPGLETNLDELTQFVATYDAPTRVASLYINGVLISSGVLVNNSTFDLPALAAMPEFRAGVGGQSPWGDPSLGGSTSDFRLYSGALTSEEVAAIFALGADASTSALLAIVPEPGTIALLSMAFAIATARSVRRRGS